MKKTMAAVVLAAGVAGSAMAADDGWASLFDGKSLAGWVQKNGTATYRVEGGAIVGKTVDGSPNSFLCTEKEYGDFELEFEVKVDPRLNSGVQIRSQTKDTPTGRVNGPQVEIEGSGAKAPRRATSTAKRPGTAGSRPRAGSFRTRNSRTASGTSTASWPRARGSRRGSMMSRSRI